MKKIMSKDEGLDRIVEEAINTFKGGLDGAIRLDQRNLLVEDAWVICTVKNLKKTNQVEFESYVINDPPFGRTILGLVAWDIQRTNSDEEKYAEINRLVEHFVRREELKMELKRRLFKYEPHR